MPASRRLYPVAPSAQKEKPVACPSCAPSASVPGLRCPRCGELAPEGAAICDNCDEILDASFLGGDETTPVEGEKTDVGPAPTSRMPARLRKRPGRQAGSRNPASPPPPSAGEPKPPHPSQAIAAPPSAPDRAV